MKTISIIGGTGLVGSYLTRLLVDKGYEVIIFTRGATKLPTRKHVAYAQYDSEKGLCDIGMLKKTEVAIHLAGAGIADKRWTKQRKKEILTSRLRSTEFAIRQLKAFAPNCKTFIASSSTGYYGPDGASNTAFAEEAPAYYDFIGSACKEWEAAARKAEPDMRTIIMRFGVVMGKEGGPFHQFARLMDLEIMPILGYGNQVVSWIEASDLARLIIFLMENKKASGVFNAVAPVPVTQKQLTKTISTIKGGLRIPTPAPAVLLKIFLGELSSEVLKSCTVSAKKVQDLGFTYQYPEITEAVKAILKK